MSRSLITNISPLPSNIPRDAAVAQLHDHASMIQANPLVIKFESTTAPAEASGDEAEFGTWVRDAFRSVRCSVMRLDH
jgi:hypothetical protein